MLNGSQLISSGVGAQAESAAASTVAPTDIFGGLLLSSSAVAASPEVASPGEVTKVYAKTEGDTLMSIHVLSERVDTGSDASIHSDASIATSATMLSETTSMETTVETTSTTIVSTTVTKLSDNDEAEAGTGQDAT